MQGLCSCWHAGAWCVGTQALGALARERVVRWPASASCVLLPAGDAAAAGAAAGAGAADALHGVLDCTHARLGPPIRRRRFC
eukprot:350753-Chlamydomonas_euryale.AAC.3